MPIVTINGTPCAVAQGVLLHEALSPQHALPLVCGGKGLCAKCRVSASGALSAPTAEECAHLSQQELQSGMRLACCARVVGDCTVTTGMRAASTAAVYADGILPDFTPDPLFAQYGVAVDIGTTTLAARLYGHSGLLAQATAMNPQSRFGADVISRIEHALAGEGEALAQCIRDGVDALLQTLAAQAGIAPPEIDALVITGNTAMLYLLTQTDPECLSHAPFAATRLFGEALQADALGLCCNGARVYLPRCMSAFVGADITCAVLATGLCEETHTRLLADIGTNGEMALWHQGVLTCCSTAAGPAFEGAGLSMGMPGAHGAIDHVALENGVLRAHVLGEGEARGICGSGVVDALACLLDAELMDATGFLEPEPAPIRDGVCLTQRDVRMVQLAKSAVYAGICTLLQSAGVAEADVARLDVAGGFGSYLHVPSAGRIGLLPQSLLPQVRVVGNAALSGACMILLCRAFAVQADALAADAVTIELSANPVFSDAYTNGMLFE